MAKTSRLKIETTTYNNGKEFTVEAIGPKHKNGDQYRGGPIRIYYDATWLYLVTDDYEGHAMVNIETLPAIVRCLNAIKKQIQAKQR